ncbi:MAG: septum formation initiator family protein [Verrucomicrobiota bacterium]
MPGHSKLFDPKNVQTATRRTEQGELWQKLLSWATVAVLIMIIGIAIALFVPVIQRHQKLIAKKNDVLELIESEENHTIHLRNQLYLLQDDPVYIERMARDVLNYGRQGETVFRFPAYEN